MGHAHLNDGHFVPLRQPEERERHADVVIEIPGGPVHGKALRQDGGRHFLRRCLADGAGDADDGDIELPPVKRRNAAERRDRGRHDDDRTRAPHRRTLG